MSTLRECIEAHERAEAARPVGAPIRIIRAVVATGDGWRFMGAHHLDSARRHGQPGTNGEVGAINALATASDALAVPVGRAGVVSHGAWLTDGPALTRIAEEGM